MIDTNKIVINQILLCFKDGVTHTAGDILNKGIITTNMAMNFKILLKRGHISKLSDGVYVITAAGLAKITEIEKANEWFNSKVLSNEHVQTNP